MSDTEAAEALAPIVPTGHDAIDEALAELNDLPNRPVAEHVVTYDALHGVLRTVLAEAGREAGTASS